MARGAGGSGGQAEASAGAGAGPGGGGRRPRRRRCPRAARARQHPAWAAGDYNKNDLLVAAVRRSSQRRSLSRTLGRTAGAPSLWILLMLCVMSLLAAGFSIILHVQSCGHEAIGV